MCGIAGYARPGGGLDLKPALDAILHRGPDGSGIFEDAAAGIGLGHVRLSIIDLSEAGAQPMTSADGHGVLSYNGEIYNYPELRDGLLAKGHEFRGSSDTEVLAEMLARDGEDALPRLNGMFAFAWFDRTKETLLLARDAYGVKPLYYVQTPDGFHFASEIRALQAMGVEQEGPDPLAVARHVCLLWNPGPETLAPGIMRLRPGEAIEVKDGRIVRQWLWFDPPARVPHIIERSVEAAAGELREHLCCAVHRQMIADVPVGAFLSGGLDSSAVVAFAREVSPDLKCFTIETAGGAEKGSTEDLPYARQVARHLGVNLEVVHVDPGGLERNLERMVSQLEEPVADPACLNVLYICELARAQGMKVLLSGTGGDDLFTGYRRHQALLMDRKLDALPASFRKLLASAGRTLPPRHAVLRRVRKFAEGLSLDSDQRLVNYFAWTQRADVVGLLSADAAAQVREADILAPLSQYLEELDADADPVSRMLALEQRYFLAEHNLPYTDKMSMAASVEVRVPFLDLDLARFASTL
ncbi:MAG: asparagine synthase (glutamine-hydrolyzing), partial [Caulobacterales bacterium]|uniref:asparagine synthase (glutamine-hydrolyzing) n=1 Tax=Glycocaulis sp. TaxID=1969725 RepID=UPI003FA0C1ED